MGTDATLRSGPAYDYVLVAGPGRSGSTFLYRLLNAHPAFCAPEIKEGYYYRSARRFERARRKLCPSNALLLDVANTAWADPRLAAVTALRRRGRRILVVVLLRRHRERAVSMMAHRESRMAFASARRLERAALRDSLTAQALGRIHGLGVDVLAVGFDTLIGDPGALLDRRFDACLAAVAAASVPLGDGLWFAPGGAAPDAPARARDAATTISTLPG